MEQNLSINLDIKEPAAAKTENANVSFIGAEAAKAIDDSLMSADRFSLDQLMELAGLSAATAAHQFYESLAQSSLSSKQICIVCGPGNNGGDGLVAARHLHHFGYDVTLLAPTISKPSYFPRLIQQCIDLNMPIHSSIENATFQGAVEYFSKFTMVIDAMFGFSFKGPARLPYSTYIEALTSLTKDEGSRKKTFVLSVDVPSGWDVEGGDIYNTGFIPDSVVSLTVPKKCMLTYKSDYHYCGGRFVPPNIAKEFNITLPIYHGASQVVVLPPITNL